MLRYLLIGLAIWFLYRFIFNFVVPVSRATADMKRKMNEFQQQMQSRNVPPQAEPEPQAAPKTKSGEYIDFEEVK